MNAIYDNNFIERLGDIPNPCRIYGLGEESGTLICAYPEGVERPVIPVPYTQETMHGFEYAFGCQLMMAGELKKGVQVFKVVRDRYKGHNRNPYNEIECGSHYARSMTSYGAMLVLSGFAFDLPSGTIAFDPKVQSDGTFQSIWTTGTGWGSVTITDGQMALRILQGNLPIDALTVQGIQMSKQDFEKSADGTIIINNNNINISRLPSVNQL